MQATRLPLAALDRGGLPAGLGATASLKGREYRPDAPPASDSATLILQSRYPETRLAA
jgi:hypothetical protein